MQKKPRNGWVVLAALYYYSVVAAFNLLKAPPLFGLLMTDFMLSESTVGIIVSASSIAGLSLVFPSALIARRFGNRRTGQFAICLSITGCLVGTFAPNLPVLLLGRLIEGCGLGMTGVVGSTTIPQYFKGKKMGLPMAIWSTWFFVGSALGSLVSGRVGHGFENWRASWLLGAIMAAVGFLVFSLFVFENKGNAPAHAAPAEALPENGKKVSDFGLGVKNLRIWCISIFFGTLLVSFVGFLSFGTEYYSMQFGMEKSAASALASLGYWFSVVGSVTAGIVSRLRRNNSLKGQFVQLIICAALCICVYPFGFLVPQRYMILYLLAGGLVNGYTCGVIFGTVPRLVRKPQVTGISMGIIFVCQNISSFSASLLVGACVEGGNWSGAVLPLLGVAVSGFLFAVAGAVLSLKYERRQNELRAAAEQAEEAAAAQAKTDELQQLQEEIKSTELALAAVRAEKETLQQMHDQALAERETLRASLAEVQSALLTLQQEQEQILADLAKAKDEAARYILEARRASVQEQQALQEAQKLKQQLVEFKTMPLWKRLFWNG